jgi:hypothetical protein
MMLLGGRLGVRGSVAVPGFRIARRVASLRQARGSTPASLADAIGE